MMIGSMPCWAYLFLFTLIHIMDETSQLVHVLLGHQIIKKKYP